MVHAMVKKGSYHDSVVLMLLTNRLAGIAGVNKISVMMATPANKEIMRQSGFATEEVDAAAANDMVIAADIEDDGLLSSIQQEIELFFTDQSNTVHSREQMHSVRSWEAAREQCPNANLAVISIPGMYAAMEAERALDEGMNVFMFSDNVSLEDEVRLKRKAHGKGLAVMGPDCGTGIIQGVPIAFTNHVRPGRIGIVGASGTGIQELTTIIDRMGEGVSNALGTGGRDLHAQVGGITMLDLIDCMEADDSVEVLIVLSKPPAKQVREKINMRLGSFSKPVVSLFMGEKPTMHEQGFFHAYTLEEAACIAVALVRGEKPVYPGEIKGVDGFAAEEKKVIKAYYSGGTLAEEAAMLIRDALHVEKAPEKHEGYMLNLDGHVVIDLGDDVYTQGTPHPMIDPAKRIECMKAAMDDPETGVILFDVMLGYGSHADMAAALLPGIKNLQDRARQENRKLLFVTTVCGTNSDEQNYAHVVAELEEADVIVCETNRAAVLTALHGIGREVLEPEKEILPKKQYQWNTESRLEKLRELLSGVPRVVNIGLQSFSDIFAKFGCEVVQFDWTPPARGNMELIAALRYLRNNTVEDVDCENRALIARIVAGEPVLKDVVLAKTVIPEFNVGKVILHAGPPIAVEDMPDPMIGSCIGAILFEKWAEDEAAARALLNSGEITWIPCHHVGAVGPMGGITTGNMPVFVVQNETYGNTGYCTMNEGIGKVLRFGAYSAEVVQRLEWMRDVLGPVLSKAIRQCGGIEVNPMIAKAIAMGDEFHQRNIAASLVFMKEIVPMIGTLDVDEASRAAVLKFLADTDQFFLNIMMASGKAIMDGARQRQKGTVVTAMCRNGHEFGIRIAGMGDEWFTGAVNTPQGLYFTGYSGEDACPDMGDSAITETVGVGGMAMIAAPAVTRFVGAGGYEDARRTSDEMTEITIGRNPNYIIPNWDFQGTCLGIDARLVVQKQITPVINTGIAHRIAGYGQIGAGTVRPPVECFEKAVLAYAHKLGSCYEDCGGNA